MNTKLVKSAAVKALALGAMLMSMPCPGRRLLRRDDWQRRKPRHIGLAI